MVYEHQVAVLHRLKILGLNPASIIDCGCAYGEWSTVVRDIFTEPHIYAFDVIDYATINHIKHIPKLSLNFGLLGEKDGDIKNFYLDNNIPMRSSYCRDLMDDFSGEVKQMYTVTLDTLLPEPVGPILMKLDTQGSELDILKGATKVLEQTEVVIMEVSTISGNEGGPEFREVVNFMYDRGFVLYDTVPSGERKELIAQMDAVFIKANHPIRDVFKMVK